MRERKFTVRLTRQELITIEQMLAFYVNEGEYLFAAMAEGFNESIKDLDIKPLMPMTVKEASLLAARLVDLLDDYEYEYDVTPGPEAAAVRVRSRASGPVSPPPGGTPWRRSGRRPRHGYGAPARARVFPSLIYGSP